MSFIFPRIVQISRPNPTTGIGALPYQGLLPTNETILFTNIPASIQERGSTQQKAGIPADTKGAPMWIIIIPLAYCPNGSIMDRDVITDDLSIRYQVSAAYWNSLGYQCECERLQT
jgi:hypothetical protein